MISVNEKSRSTRTNTCACAGFELAFFDFTAGRINDIEKQRILSHLQTCTSCRDLYNGAGDVFQKIRTECTDKSVTADFRKKLQRAILNENNKKRKHARFWYTKRGRALFAVGTAAICAGLTVAVIKNPFLPSAAPLTAFPAKQIPAVWKLDNFATFKESIAQSPVVFGAHVYGIQADGAGRRLVAADLHKGKTIWRSEPGLLGFIAVDSPRVYALRRVNGNTELCAWETGTGRMAWAASYPAHTAGELKAPVVAHNNLFFSKGNSLYCVNGRNGKTLWEYRAQEAGAVSVPCAGGHVVYVAGAERINALTFDKQSVWSFSYPEPMVTTPAPLVTIGARSLFIAHRSVLGNSSLFCLDAASGKLVWRKDNEECRSMVASGQHLFIRGRDVRALDQATGRCSWTHAIDGCGPLTCEGNVLYVSEAAEKGILVKLDALSGRILQRTASSGSCSGIIVAGDLELVHSISGVLYAYKNRPVSADGNRASLGPKNPTGYF